MKYLLFVVFKSSADEGSGNGSACFLMVAFRPSATRLSAAAVTSLNEIPVLDRCSSFHNYIMCFPELPLPLLLPLDVLMVKISPQSIDQQRVQLPQTQKPPSGQKCPAGVRKRVVWTTSHSVEQHLRGHGLVVLKAACPLPQQLFPAGHNHVGQHAYCCWSPWSHYMPELYCVGGRTFSAGRTLVESACH